MASDQEASSSNSALKTYKYDIFLSFRGIDTRNGFTDHLYQALIKGGFRVFRDNEELEHGEVISTQLKQAIEDSCFAVVVLSKNYASSSWCLNELLHILYSRDNLCQQVFPIFYDVDPSDVRYQKRKFDEAFAGHQMRQRYNMQVIKSWRESLAKVANLSGWDCNNQSEAKIIHDVVEKLWIKLRSILPPYSEELIGIDNKVQQLEPLLEMGMNDVRFVGLWGLPGVGKTTIARAVFEKYRRQFDISCFLHNVKATSSERDGEVQLQSKLLSHLNIKNMGIKDTYDGKQIIQNRFRNIKVLLILDDVSQTSHLENLAKSPNWFGAGSRVIITTRDSHMLRTVHEVFIHEVETMSPCESLQLFCQKAFGRGESEEDFLKVSKDVCDYAKGLPLALSVLGSYFRGRTNVQEWQDALEMLKKDPHKDISGVLEISFNSLNDTEKNIFLDIACFFNGWRKKVITHMLESCGFMAKIGITTLQEKCMLNDYDECLVMHDLLEQMGRRIVVDNSPIDVGYRSRLWSKGDIDEVMQNNLGTKKIQGMVSSTSCEACWHPEAFLALRNLRLLVVSSSDFNLPDGLKCLSHALKVLHWTKYPLDTLPSGTQLHKLVDLTMRCSKLKKLWDKSLCSKNLKVLDLSYSKSLIETPDFSELPNLERLDLEGCEDLVDLHASIGQHKNLQVLNLKGCENLKAQCPKKLEMSALKEFVLFGCIQVKCLPEFGVNMKNLETFNVGETSIVKLPESLGLLTGIETLNLRGCKNLICLPQSIHNLKRLKAIDVSGCLKFNSLPEKLNEMEALEEIDASETNITEVSSSIVGLEKIRKLSFRGCKKSTSNSWSFILPLKYALFWGHSTHKGFTLPASIWSIKSLTNLDLSYCNIDDGCIPNDLGGLSSLEQLDLSGNLFKSLPTSCITNLLNLEFLYLNSCSELRSLPQSGPSLTLIDARRCGSLETMADEQLFHLFSTFDQVKLMSKSEALFFNQGKDGALTVTMPGSELPSWFENQKDLYLNNNREASMIIDMPPCEEEMLGFGLCVLMEDMLYYTWKGPYALPYWRLLIRRCDLASPLAPNENCDDLILAKVPMATGEIKSNHLWIMFWKPSERFNHVMQLRECKRITLTFNAGGMMMDETYFNAKGMKCGWRVISKAL